MIADDVVRFIEQMGLGPAHIAGVSDGGITALVVGMIWLVIRRNRPKPERPEIADVTDKQIENPALTAEQQLAALPKPEIDPELARVERELVSIAKNDPAMMASLIRTWMAEDKVGAAR